MRLFLLVLQQLSLWSLLGIHVAEAQTQRSVTLKWNDSANQGMTQYTIYRVAGVCPAVFSAASKLTGPSFMVGSPAGGFTFQDGTVAVSTTYCYIVTATDPGGPESGPSNQAEAIVPSAPRMPPTNLTVTVN